METLNKTLIGKHYIAPLIFFLPVLYYLAKFGSFKKAFEKLHID